MQGAVQRRSFASWPLTARLPLLGAALILVVGIGTSQMALAWLASEQERSLERITAVYLDGLAANVLQLVLAKDADGVAAALRRTMLFQQGIRERQLIVHTPEGRELASERLPGAKAAELAPALRARLEERSSGIVLDEKSETGWAYRTLYEGGQRVARIYAELDLGEILEQRRSLRIWLALYTLAASVAAAMLGYALMRRLLRPVSILTTHLAKTQSGELALVPERELGPPRTEFGRLLRGFNAMAASLKEREELATRLAQQERSSVLGRLAATIAHEVRNPLGGMFNAVDTVRKFGADPAIRSQALNLIERGLASIRDVVTATLATHRGTTEGRALRPEDLGDLRTLIAPEARRRALEIVWRSEIAHQVAVDAGLVRQLVLNLLLNACVAAPRGGRIEFVASVVDGALRLVVADNGPGLPAELRTALETAANGGGDPPASPGIGLSVILRLLRQSGGTISVGTNEGGGTRMTLMLPLRGPALADAAE